MLINLSPQVRDDTLSVNKNGDILTINGQSIDFGPLEDGAVLPASAVDCEFVVGTITRTAGNLEVTLILPISWDSEESCRFPKPIVMTSDGVVELPGGFK